MSCTGGSISSRASAEGACVRVSRERTDKEAVPLSMRVVKIVGDVPCSAVNEPVQEYERAQWEGFSRHCWRNNVYNVGKNRRVFKRVKGGSQSKISVKGLIRIPLARDNRRSQRGHDSIGGGVAALMLRNC